MYVFNNITLNILSYSSHSECAYTDCRSLDTRITAFTWLFARIRLLSQKTDQHLLHPLGWAADMFLSHFRVWEFAETPWFASKNAQFNLHILPFFCSQPLPTRKRNLQSTKSSFMALNSQVCNRPCIFFAAGNCQNGRWGHCSRNRGPLSIHWFHIIWYHTNPSWCHMISSTVHMHLLIILSVGVGDFGSFGLPWVNHHFWP